MGLMVMAGCQTAPPVLRTPQPEQLVVPPEDDPRFSQPMQYPKELLNRPPVKPTSPNGPTGPRGSGPMSGAGGMPGQPF